jgi:hypothetical protein
LLLPLSTGAAMMGAYRALSFLLSSLGYDHGVRAG